MMSPRRFMQMTRLAKRPPSTKRMIVTAIMIGITALIAGIEKLGYWPDWATAERSRKVEGKQAPPPAEPAPTTPPAD